ncbi:hypothetical protein BXP70_13285 [Hymenobacter crusticola]|uniref:Uncharacterized protein n=1 Tax=Hymenobacter crusticola TaxID=1770526 RepID=A0A243WD82_9BACT|nr:hypothetical protein BXP70_13285 [Hymenobacter crusticola]
MLCLAALFLFQKMGCLLLDLGCSEHPPLFGVRWRKEGETIDGVLVQARASYWDMATVPARRACV